MTVMKKTSIVATYNDHRQWSPIALTLLLFLTVYSSGSMTKCAGSVVKGMQHAAPGGSTDSMELQQRRPEEISLSDQEAIPTFEQTASNVTAFEGQTVYLPCRVHNLADKVVSWMRSRDLHILTSGTFAFSSDGRFKPQHLPGSDAWTLQLDRVKATDAGRYECQVNTEPKIMYAVQLIVRDPNKPEGYDEPHSQQTRISFESTAPVAAIMGPREQRVPAGSTITLKCVVTSPYQTRPIKGVHWFLDNKLLTFQAARGGINVQTVTDTAQTLTEATLANLTRRDSGKYSCRPNEGKADSIMLHVDQGERTEAMQRDAAFTTSSAAVEKRPFFLLALVNIFVALKFAIFH